MSIELLKTVTSKFTTIFLALKRYSVLVFLIAICSVYGFLTYRINALTEIEPTSEAISEKLKTVQRPKIDQQAIDKLRELEQENIEVQTLFQQARDNPFSE